MEVAQCATLSISEDGIAEPVFFFISLAEEYPEQKGAGKTGGNATDITDHISVFQKKNPG